MATNENVFPLEENRMVIETEHPEASLSLDKPPAVNLAHNTRTLNNSPAPSASWVGNDRRATPAPQEVRSMAGVSGLFKNPLGAAAAPAPQPLQRTRQRKDREGDFFQSAFAKHRFSKDIEELTLCRNATFLPHAKVNFHLVSRENTMHASTDGNAMAQDHPRNELSRIFCDIEPCEGLYKGVQWEFELDIPASYPFHPPTIKCLDQLFHPNIDIESGQVALKVLSDDWSPVLTLRAVVLSLVLLFVEPNLECTFNETAAELYSADHIRFVQTVRKNIECISASRLKKDNRMYRRKKREATTSADPHYQPMQRPAQRVHYNPVVTKPSITGKRQCKDGEMGAEHSSIHTHSLVQKLNSCKLSGSKRRKTDTG